MSRLLLIALLAVAAPRPSRADTAADEAVKRAQVGETLFRAGNYEDALIQYQSAFERSPSNDYLFNMAQCEYNLGQVKNALAHYEQFLSAIEKSAGGKPARARSEAMEMARSRIEAINRRKSVFSIYTTPVGADVRLEGPTTMQGQAPNEFHVSRGKYVVRVSKPSYQSQTQEWELGVAETKQLFFKLDPIPARLEIYTRPGNATLYVRGNRAQNPYIQQVDPGSYEIYAEASEYRPRREVVVLGPGQRLAMDFELEYVQRSGRPELIGFWTAAGAVAGSTAVLAALETPGVENTASGTLVATGGIAGGIAGAIISTAFVPDYIRDNVALFRIGAMSIGTVEGAVLGLAVKGRPSMSAAWTGGLVGLGVGALTGVWLDYKAPNYGRVAVIQSGAVIGAIGGALAVPAIKETGAPLARYEPLGILAGLNLGLGAGLALAYLPDQHHYGPSWKRVLLVDLAVAAGTFAGVVGTTLSKCITDPNPGPQCSFAPSQRNARFALAGGAVGLAAGWLLTRNLDRNENPPSERQALRLLPLPSAIAVQTREGTATVIPGLAAQGRF